MLFRKHLNDQYKPVYFLAALGNGGMAITFFIYLMFLVPHPDTPIPTFESVQAVLTGGNMLAIGGVLLAMLGIVVFAVRHFWTLAWNLREYVAFKQTPAFAKLRESNAEATLMAIPLTLAMSINVLFVLGGVFVPGLWAVVEYLFPFSLLGFALTGAYALTIFGHFFTRILVNGNYDCTQNNSLAKMITVFAFTMVGVGFASSAAMSHNMLTVAISTFGSIFFTSAAILLGIMAFILGFRAMLEHGVDIEGSVSLWIIIPILTLLGITFIRLSHGLHHHFDGHTGNGDYFVLTSAFVSLQLLFGGLGYLVMRRNGYYSTYISGEGRSHGSYALICPGVALFVFGMFFIHLGLVQNGLVAKFSPAHYALMLPLIYVQVKTILVMLRLDSKLLRPDSTPPALDTPEQPATTP